MFPGAEESTTDQEPEAGLLAFKVKQFVLVLLLGFSILNYLLAIIKLNVIVEMIMRILSRGHINHIRVDIVKPVLKIAYLVAFIISICLDLLFIYGIITQNISITVIFTVFMVATAGCKSIGAQMAINAHFGAFEAIFTALWAVAYMADLWSMQKNEVE